MEERKSRQNMFKFRNHLVDAEDRKSRQILQVKMYTQIQQLANVSADTEPSAIMSYGRATVVTGPTGVQVVS